MMRLLRSRRAVSPVIATVLMILVVITGMSVLFGFFVNYTRDFQTGSGSAVLESLVIEDVHFTRDNVEVSVYNVGKVDFKITAFYINDKWNSIEPVAVSVGAQAELVVSSEFILNVPYNFKIVTERGSAFEGRYIWEA
jgi:flagellin-like protein